MVSSTAREREPLPTPLSLWVVMVVDGWLLLSPFAGDKHHPIVGLTPGAAVMGIEAHPHLIVAMYAPE